MHLITKSPATHSLLLYRCLLDIEGPSEFTSGVQQRCTIASQTWGRALVNVLLRLRVICLDGSPQRTTEQRRLYLGSGAHTAFEPGSNPQRCWERGGTADCR